MINEQVNQQLTLQELQAINGGLFGKNIFKWIACFIDKDHPYCPDDKKEQNGSNSVKENEDGTGCTDDLNIPF